MGETTTISWTMHTFNPWWGCVKVSPACTHCYAATFAGRFNVEWGPKAERRFFDAAHWNEPRKWDRKAKKEGVRKRVFCASMADVFEELPAGHPDTQRMDESRKALWHLIQDTPNLDWLLLTKRPENVMRMARPFTGEGCCFPDNVWIGTTAENQEQADARIPHLLRVPCAVRFLSAEPLLGPVDLLRTPKLGGHHDYLRGDYSNSLGQGVGPSIDWVIVGGESGPGARPMHPDWARSLRDQCQAAGVAFHFKQHGEFVPEDHCDFDSSPGAALSSRNAQYHVWPGGTRSYRVGKKSAGRLLDGRTWDELPGVR